MMSVSALKGNWRNIALGCSGSLALSAVCIWLLVYAFFGHNPFNDRSFEKKVWFSHANDYDANNPRGHMAEDAQRQIKKGMTREQVIKILGKPDSDESPDLFEYNLGYWSNRLIDMDTLDVRFDRTGRVIETRIVQH